MVRRERAGMALPLVLLLLMALAAFGHAALSLSLGELQATWAFRSLVGAGTAAEMGLRLALSGPIHPLADRELWAYQPVVSGQTEDGLTYLAGRRWLSEEFFLLESVGGTAGWSGRKKLYWIGWSLHPGVRLKAFLAAAEVGSELLTGGGGSMRIDSFFRPPEGWPPSACGSDVPLLDSLFGGVLPVPVATGLGTQLEGHELPSYPPALGLLSGKELLTRADAWEERNPDSVPEPERGCPGGIGPPVFEGTPGDLFLKSGRVCGVLITGGDLRIRRDAVFQGLALVGGDLILEGHAGFDGLAKIGGSLRLGSGGTFRGSACSALWAMEGIQALSVPVLLSPGVGSEGF